MVGLRLRLRRKGASEGPDMEPGEWLLPYAAARAATSASDSLAASAQAWV